MSGGISTPCSLHGVGTWGQERDTVTLCVSNLGRQDSGQIQLHFGGARSFYVKPFVSQDWLITVVTGSGLLPVPEQQTLEQVIS